MSTITDRVSTMYKARLADNLGDSIEYRPGAVVADAETVNAQIEPWSYEQEADDGAQFDQLETVITLVVGTASGDVSAVAVGDTCVFGGITWAVMKILSRWGATGPVRLGVSAQARTALAGQDVIRPGAAGSPGGRFNTRGG